MPLYTGRANKEKVNKLRMRIVLSGFVVHAHTRAGVELERGREKKRESRRRGKATKRKQTASKNSREGYENSKQEKKTTVANGGVWLHSVHRCLTPGKAFETRKRSDRKQVRTPSKRCSALLWYSTSSALAIASRVKEKKKKYTHWRKQSAKEDVLRLSTRRRCACVCVDF